MKYLLAASILALSFTPALAQSTTRYEPRPFYGATVTIENGVRVWRPLPPHDRIIIDPSMGYGWADAMQPRMRVVPSKPYAEPVPQK